MDTDDQQAREDVFTLAKLHRISREVAAACRQLEATPLDLRAALTLDRLLTSDELSWAQGVAIDRRWTEPIELHQEDDAGRQEH